MRVELSSCSVLVCKHTSLSGHSDLPNQPLSLSTYCVCVRWFFVLRFVLFSYFQPCIHLSNNHHNGHDDWVYRSWTTCLRHCQVERKRRTREKQQSYSHTEYKLWEAWGCVNEWSSGRVLGKCWGPRKSLLIGVDLDQRFFLRSPLLYNGCWTSPAQGCCDIKWEWL